MKQLIATAAAAAIFGLASPASAQAPGAPSVTLVQAVAAAEQAVGAKAFEAELDTHRGRLVYEVNLVKDGRAMEAEIDATTGQLVRQSKASLQMPWDASQLRAAQLAPKPLAQTIAMIEQSTKGRVTEIGLERRNQRHYYEVELAGAQDRDVLVDIQTGAITPLLDD